MLLLLNQQVVVKGFLIHREHDDNTDHGCELNCGIVGVGVYPIIKVVSRSFDPESATIRAVISIQWFTPLLGSHAMIGV